MSARSILRQAGRQPRIVAAAVTAGFIFGIAYRAAFDPAVERNLANYLLSGLHGIGLALAIWVVQAAFASGAQSLFGAALRRFPLAGEVIVRALVTTAALIVTGLALQFALYAESQHLAWLTRHWFTVELPRIVASAFALSLVIGVVSEAARLIGAPLLTSLVLGTYHRPTRRSLIVMFLDLAKSTGLAETMGELRVHDLITRFFFDIDEPIADYGGTVHAYVGDEVIVSWPIGRDATRNARAVACFFAIERKMAALEPEYAAEFGVAPSFRAGIHAGPVIISECGDAKRQLAFFGDTMNVAARLCDYCKTINDGLVISGDLMRIMALRTDLVASPAKRITVRGRQEPVEALSIREPQGETTIG